MLEDLRSRLGMWTWQAIVAVFDFLARLLNRQSYTDLNREADDLQEDLHQADVAVDDLEMRNADLAARIAELQGTEV